MDCFTTEIHSLKLILIELFDYMAGSAVESQAGLTKKPTLNIVVIVSRSDSSVLSRVMITLPETLRANIHILKNRNAESKSECFASKYILIFR